MKLIVDAKLCQGHGLCVISAPLLFDLDERDVASPLVEEVPTTLQASALDAIRQCPEAAISMTID
jgi:ferredoxin